MVEEEGDPNTRDESFKSASELAETLEGAGSKDTGPAHPEPQPPEVEYNMPWVRFLTGARSEEGDRSELEHLIASEAIDRTVVTTTLMNALNSDRVHERRSAANRVARMKEVVPEARVRLQELADADADSNVRETARKALEAHSQQES